MARWGLALALFLTVGPAGAGEPKSGANRLEGEQGQPGKQVAGRLREEGERTFSFLLYLPKDYDAQERWPLLLFLHGAGERGNDLELVKMHGPPRLLKEGKEFPFLVVSPQCPETGDWKVNHWRPETLLALLDQIVARYKVDSDRVYVTGLSMGGFGVWALAAQAPERLAAIVPICGGGDPAWAARLARLPIWAFHGAQDSVVPLAGSQRMIDAVRSQGGEVKFTIYPGVDHDSWTETYANPKLYEWLLQQRRPPAEKPAP